MNWYRQIRAQNQPGLFGQTPEEDAPFPNQQNLPIFDPNQIPEPQPRLYTGWNMMEDLSNAKHCEDAFFLLKKYNVGYDKIDWPGGADPVYIFEFGGTDYVLECSTDNVFINDADSWVRNINDLSLDSYIPMPNFNEEFWEGVGSGSFAYHATKPEYTEVILQEGLQPRDETRGMSNRHTGPAVFASLSEEAVTPYGDAVLSIDLGAMKAAGYMPQVDQESPLENDKQIEAIAWKIGLEDFHNEDRGWEGIDNDTIVIDGAIPPQFLKLLT